MTLTNNEGKEPNLIALVQTLTDNTGASPETANQKKDGIVATNSQKYC
jgi:hypothetical protein